MYQMFQHGIVSHSHTQLRTSNYALRCRDKKVYNEKYKYACRQNFFMREKRFEMWVREVIKTLVTRMSTSEREAKLHELQKIAQQRNYTQQLTKKFLRHLLLGSNEYYEKLQELKRLRKLYKNYKSQRHATKNNFTISTLQTRMETQLQHNIKQLRKQLQQLRKSKHYLIYRTIDTKLRNITLQRRKSDALRDAYKKMQQYEQQLIKNALKVTREYANAHLVF